MRPSAVTSPSKCSTSRRAAFSTTSATSTHFRSWITPTSPHLWVIKSSTHQPVPSNIDLSSNTLRTALFRCVASIHSPHPTPSRTSKEPRKNPESLVNERINNRLKRCLRVFDYCHHLIIVNGFVLSGLSTSEQHRLGDAVPDGSLGGSRNGSPPRRRLSRR